MQLQEKTIPHRILAKPWEVVGSDIFMVNNETLLCIVDYYSKFPVVKKVENMLVEDLIQATKAVFIKLGLPFVSEWFKEFCRILNIDQAIRSSYHHHSNGQV